MYVNNTAVMSCLGVETCKAIIRVFETIICVAEILGFLQERILLDITFLREERNFHSP